MKPQMYKLLSLVIGLFVFLATHQTFAQDYSRKVSNQVAVFAALNKVTARISHLEVKIDETVEFGALKITPKKCNTRPKTETPWTTAFVQVDETKLNGEISRLFSGWMFSESPGLHAVEHPVFDVWLTNCKIPSGGVSGDKPSKSPGNFNDDSSLFR